ncbi:MAG: FAD-binding oxidoreductase [Flavobacteriales bacterium]|nr:FAD-binding oxidoreductase [Flavobacteriales bacterium]MBP9079176.1 FAD-binding oxidoreductase [Flavobacteriales bacterium]
MQSIWESRSFPNDADLVVVGAGITGLFTAWHARHRDPLRKVVVLERGPHPCGASVKNAGFACFGSPSQLLHDLDQEGADTALHRVEERWRGLQELRATLGDAAIGFEPVGGYEVFMPGDPLYTRVAARFGELNRALHGIFGQDVFTWADERTGALGLHAGHLAWNPLEGAVDSGRLMQRLLGLARAEGVEVRFNAAVQGWEELPAHVELRLEGGGRVKASQAVLATNGYSRGLQPSIDVVPGRGQVLLTTPIPGLRLRGTFHMEEGYYYFRDLGGRVLLGGGRHLDKAGETTTVDATTAPIQAALEQLLHNTIVPGRPFTIERRWSGIMGFRTQGGPAVVERISPHVVVAAGLGGIGVAIGIRVGRRAAGLVE